MSYDYTIRKMVPGADLNRLVGGMWYPYGYIEESTEGYYSHYNLDAIRRPILVEPEQAPAGDFPHNIQEHFWIRLGENDGDSWISCGVLTNGNYFLFTGSCDYTGFDCQGGMNLWVSSSWQNIVDHGMGETIYRYYTMDLPTPEEAAASAQRLAEAQRQAAIETAAEAVLLAIEQEDMRQFYAEAKVYDRVDELVDEFSVRGGHNVRLTPRRG